MDIWKRFGEKEVSHSMAHYLQAVAALKVEKGFARVGDIAERLGVSKSGVTSMLRSLRGRGLVDHERYGCVELTPSGQRLAERTESSRRVLTMFLTEILGVATKVAGIVAEIAGAAKEQAAGIDQVNVAIDQMNRVTQQNAASSEESSSASQELAGQAQELAAMVGTFQFDEGGGAQRARKAGKPSLPAAHVVARNGARGGSAETAA